jgi:tetratricopeptide (TPR) repeat protein
MVTRPPLSHHNQRELGRLLVSLRANDQRLDLLLAVCDDPDFRDRLIQHYETVLQQEGFVTYRAKLNPKEPSLKETLAELVRYNPSLQDGEKSVVTVLGASELFGVRLSEDKSEQEKFFFSLQWTREALREFEFPVVIWLSDPIATGVARQAEDFWSWRSGVFEFEAAPLPGAPLPMQQVQDGLRSTEQTQTLEGTTSSVADLEQQIAELRQQNPQSPLLTTLYSDLGDAYRQQKDHEPALKAYKAALKSAGHNRDRLQEAEIFLKIGRTLQDCRRYEKAQHFFEQALKLFQELNASDREAYAYYRLGMVTFNQRKFEEARAYFQAALSLYVEMKDHDWQASTYHQLGMVAQELREYEQARQFYQQALDIFIEYNDRYEQADTYHQLGIVAEELGEYEQARQFYQQALDIKIEFNDRYSQASTYFQLGKVSEALGNLSEAKTEYLQDLQITAEFNDEYGLGISLRNLARFYREYPEDSLLKNVAQCLNTTVEEVRQRFDSLTRDE